MDDVAIVGAGPAGSFAALLLARAGFRVRLFDRARFPRPKLCGDTLNPGACRTLSRHLPLTTLLVQAKPLAGMLLTGPGGASIRGSYGEGIHGYAVERYIFDQWLLERAMASGARAEEECTVEAPVVSEARVTGVRIRGRVGSLAEQARLVIAADGRHSKLAFDLRLASHPQRPRRWAIGGYFADVDGLCDRGEMHIRRGHYVGVAPMPDGRANTCLVLPHARGDSGWRDATDLLTTTLAGDERLAPRFAHARLTQPPVVLGPMAVDVRDAGVPGLLLAGDAAGFIDPMTGDGLTLALRGGELAAETAIGLLSGRVNVDDAPRLLRRRRHDAFARKWRFNRALRQLVAVPATVAGASVAARAFPSVFESMIRYAGDVRPH
jgi:flavin-dependent dehydrogenase